MSKEATIIALGIWIAALPFLGFPGSWRTALLVLSGLALASIGLMLRRELLESGALSLMRRDHAESYVENDRHESTQESETPRG